MQNDNSKFKIIKNEKHSKGQAVFTLAVFFVFLSLSVVMGLSVPAALEFNNSEMFLSSQKSYYLVESGAEDVSYRIKTAKNYGVTEVLNNSGFYATTTVSQIFVDEKEIVATGTVSDVVRKVKINLTTDDSASFNYGVQAGDGGFVMENNSTVSGNVYSNGPVSGQNSNLVKGDVVSAGPAGSVAGITSTSSVYAHNISNSTISKDAYYVNIFNTSVGGNLYPGSADQATSTLPISDATIQEWENATASSTISSPCPYTLTASATLGNVKILCNLTIKSNTVLTLTGPVWIVGNIEIENQAVIKLDSSLGKKSVAIIADNPSNRTTSSKIEFQNSAVFQNSGIKGSYVLAISQNNSAESGGGEKAITVENSVSGDLLAYAGHGEILLKNSISLKEVTAYRIRLQNTANVIYESGLANLIFKSGPSGGFEINKWGEI